MYIIKLKTLTVEQEQEKVNQSSTKVNNIISTW